MAQASDTPMTSGVSRRGLLTASAILGPSAVVSCAAPTDAVNPAASPDGNGPPGESANMDAAYVRRDELMVNVRDHGAIGDGRTDDTAAINALLSKIDSGGPQRIFFPPGQYLHTGIKVVGKSGFELLGPGELVATTPTVNEYLNVEECADFKILGIQSRHENPTARRTTPARAISITRCRAFEIGGCHAFQAEGVGIMMNHCSDAVVHGNRVHDTQADGIGLYGDTHHITVSSNRTYETGDDGISQVGVTEQEVRPHDNTIVSNIVGRSYARGISVVGAYNTIITGNAVETTQAGGIYVASEQSRSTYGCTGVVVSGNVVKDANTLDPDIDQAAIFVFGENEPVIDVTLANNQITGANGEGIRVGGSAPGTYRVTVIGNSVSGTGASGIELWSVEDVSVVGNEFADTGKGGIFASSGPAGAVVVTGNTVKNPNTAGSVFAAIGMTQATEAAVILSANTVIGATSAVYGLDAPAQAIVYGNNLNGAGVRGGSDGMVEMYGNVSVSASAAPADAGGGKGVIAMRNAASVPTTPPGNGGILYVDEGALKYMGSGGTVTTLGRA